LKVDSPDDALITRLFMLNSFVLKIQKECRIKLKAICEFLNNMFINVYPYLGRKADRLAILYTYTYTLEGHKQRC